MAQRGRTGEEGIRAATRKAIRQLESTGTVAVGDVSNALAHLDLLERSSLRAVVFYELIGSRWQCAFTRPGSSTPAPRSCASPAGAPGSPGPPTHTTLPASTATRPPAIGGRLTGTTKEHE
jgi:hypothetical protein